MIAILITYALAVALTLAFVGVERLVHRRRYRRAVGRRIRALRKPTL